MTSPSGGYGRSDDSCGIGANVGSACYWPRLNVVVPTNACTLRLVVRAFERAVRKAVCFRRVVCFRKTLCLGRQAALASEGLACPAADHKSLLVALVVAKRLVGLLARALEVDL